MQHVDVVVPIAVPITAGMLGASPRLKLVIQFGVGVDAIDIPAATRLGITVANIPSLGTGNALSVAEHAIFLTLASLRHHGAMRRALEAQRLGVPEGLTLWGSTVLVVGYGNIAQELVTRWVGGWGSGGMGWGRGPWWSWRRTVQGGAWGRKPTCGVCERGSLMMVDIIWGICFREERCIHGRLDGGSWDDQSPWLPA